MTIQQLILFFCGFAMALADFENITFSNFKWLNEPTKWNVQNEILEFTTDNNTDFWQGTYYDFYHNSGHVFGVEIKDDFTLTVSTFST